jgi:hypothetical protein
MSSNTPEPENIQPKSQDDVLAEMHEEFLEECRVNGVSPILMEHYGFITGL